MNMCKKYLHFKIWRIIISYIIIQKYSYCVNISHFCFILTLWGEARNSSDQKKNVSFWYDILFLEWWQVFTVAVHVPLIPERPHTVFLQQIPRFILMGLLRFHWTAWVDIGGVLYHWKRLQALTRTSEREPAAPITTRNKRTLRICIIQTPPLFHGAWIM